MDFSTALAFLKAGQKMFRSGWNGKGIWVEAQRPDVHSKMTVPYLYMNVPARESAYEENTPAVRSPWVPSQSDLFADDWYDKDEHDAAFKA